MKVWQTNSRYFGSDLMGSLELRDFHNTSKLLNISSRSTYGLSRGVTLFEMLELTLLSTYPEKSALTLLSTYTEKTAVSTYEFKSSSVVFDNTLCRATAN